MRGYPPVEGEEDAKNLKFWGGQDLRSDPDRAKLEMLRALWLKEILPRRRG